MGDRVVYALEAGAVPLGFHGTVVGVQETVIDVVFDSTFMGGTNLGDRCSDFRGLSLPFWSVINLSYPSFAHQPNETDQHHHHSNKRHDNQHHPRNNQRNNNHHNTNPKRKNN